MMKVLTGLTVLFLAFGLVACGGDDHKDHGHGKDEHKDEDAHKDHDHGKDGHKDEDAHKDHDHGKDGHKDEDAHKDHDHGKDGHKDGEDAHGERHELGKANVGGFSLTVASLGEIEAGHEGVLDVDVAGGTPATVRAWVGVESARGSLKGKLEKEGDGFHGHVEVPSPMPSGSAVWVEIEDASGKKSKVSFKLH